MGNIMMKILSQTLHKEFTEIINVFIDYIYISKYSIHLMYPIL